MEKIFIKVSEETKHKALVLMLKLGYNWVIKIDINVISNLLGFVGMENGEVTYINTESLYDELRGDGYKEVNLNYKNVREVVKQTELIEHEGGAVRESKDHKLDFTLIPIEMLERVAKRFTGGARTHGKNNWMKGDEDFKEGCKASAFRHFIAWIKGDKDEDHMRATVFNLFAYEYLNENLSKDETFKQINLTTYEVSSTGKFKKKDN